jgi:hypothetical protein
MEYLALLTLDDFRDAVQRAGCETIHVQDYRRSEIMHGGAYQFDSSSVVCTARGNRQQFIYVARVEVERVELWEQNARIRRQAMAINAQRAQALIEKFLGDSLTYVSIHPGLLLFPGLMGELHKIHTSHDLWRWEGRDQDHPENRRLMPIEQAEDSPAAGKQESSMAQP